MSERWNCHDHRDELHVSDNCSVYHPEHGQLCSWEIHYDCVLYFPILFKTKALAYKWIKDGTIAEIQESWSYLQIGFATKGFEKGL